MGVHGLHYFVKQRAQEYVGSEKLTSFLPSVKSRDGRIRVIIDGNNFAYALMNQSRSPGCFGGEPAVYEYHMRQFLDNNLTCCDEIIIVMGCSIVAGSPEWVNKRAGEKEGFTRLFENIRAGQSPHSLGKYGRDGLKNYVDQKASPPWFVNQIIEIAAEFPRVKVYQAECDKDYAIMDLAVTLGCPIMSNDSDFLLFAVQPVIKCDFNWRGGNALIYRKRWYNSPRVRLHSYHLPLVSALSFNPECDFTKDDLMPFWVGLIGASEFENDNIPQVLPYIVDWLSDNFRDAGDCASIERICRKLDEVALKCEEMYHELVRKSYYCERARRNRLIRSIRRFMVMDKAYPWEEDKTFNTAPAFYRSKKGKHPLLRAAKNTEAFDSLPEEIASVLESSRDACLSSALPAPIFTELVFQIYNCIHPLSSEDEEAQEEDVEKIEGNKLPVISALLTKYLRRELAILDVDEARYFRYKLNTKSWFATIEQEWAFRYLSKREVPTLPRLYKSSREEKVRAFLACFDAEIIMFIDPNFSSMPCFIITFLACLRYLWAQTNMEEWEIDAFVAQFALLDLFTSPDKHFRRLKWLFGGGEETCPVELPACERSITLANLFAAVYYAIMRCQVITGLPFQEGNGKPCLKDIFSGSVFACTYSILKKNPAKSSSGRHACGIYDDKLLGMDPQSNNKMEVECYEKAATVYDRMRANFITPLRKFDVRLAEMKTAETSQEEELKQKAEKEKLRALRKARKAQDANPLDRDFSNLLQKHESVDKCDGWLNRALGGEEPIDARSPNPTIDEHAFSQMQLEASPSPEIAPFEEQTIRDVSPQLSLKDFMSDNSEIPPQHEEKASHQPQPEELPTPDRVDDTPVRRPASVQAAPKPSQKENQTSGIKIDDIFDRIKKASETPEPAPAEPPKSSDKNPTSSTASASDVPAAKSPSKEIPKNMQEFKQLKKSLTKAISKNMLAQESSKS